VAQLRRIWQGHAVERSRHFGSGHYGVADSRDDARCFYVLQHSNGRSGSPWSGFFVAVKSAGCPRWNRCGNVGLLRERATGDEAMSKIIYEIIEHDGGWAYKVGTTYSETFHSRDDALAAARIAAAEQQVAGSSEGIEYEDSSGKWHNELAEGTDRPEADVAEK